MISYVGSEFRVRGEVRHERVQGDRGSDMGTREMFNEGGVRWDGRVAFQTYPLTEERSGQELKEALSNPCPKSATVSGCVPDLEPVHFFRQPD